MNSAAEKKTKKIIVGVTGASGAIYAKLLIEKLYTLGSQIEDCALVFSDNAKDVWHYELGDDSWKTLPFKSYASNDFFAPAASGSAGYNTMIICPCSVATLGRIANGISTDLMTRSADVMLKERKKLILCVREMPYSIIHLNNMKIATEAGAVICPASPSFYSQPADITALSYTVVDKLLALAGFEFERYRWGEK
ncbi:MAG: UbiX family flavin prenyltransferase [Bacteroidota bacterium]